MTFMLMTWKISSIFSTVIARISLTILKVIQIKECHSYYNDVKINMYKMVASRNDTLKKYVFSTDLNDCI